MKNQNFGIEIELTGITRENAAKTMATYFGTRHTYEGGSYDTHCITNRALCVAPIIPGGRSIMRSLYGG